MTAAIVICCLVVVLIGVALVVHDQWLFGGAACLAGVVLLVLCAVLLNQFTHLNAELARLPSADQLTELGEVKQQLADARQQMDEYQQRWEDERKLRWRAEAQMEHSQHPGEEPVIEPAAQEEPTPVDAGLHLDNVRAAVPVATSSLQFSRSAIADADHHFYDFVFTVTADREYPEAHFDVLFYDSNGAYLGKGVVDLTSLLATGPLPRGESRQSGMAVLSGRATRGEVVVVGTM